MYEIKIGREIRNGVLHIVVALVLAYTLFPTLFYSATAIILLIIGIAREIYQKLRGKKQPLYIHILDSISFAFGGLLYVYLREKFKIKPDEL